MKKRWIIFILILLLLPFLVFQLHFAVQTQLLLFSSYDCYGCEITA